MSTENEAVSGTLAADEKAYFDSRGEAEIKEIPAVDEKPEPETVEAETEELDTVETEVETETDKPTGQSKVPLAALTKTRAEAKVEREKRIAAEARAQVLEERWNMALKGQEPQPVQTPVEEIPNPETDPQGAIAWATKQIADQIAAKKAETEQTAEQQKANAEWQQVYQAVNDEYNEAVTADANVKTAHEALLDSHGREFLAMGLTREEAQAEVSRLEAEHIRFARHRGIPIGKYITGLAEARGWKAGSAAAAPDPAKEIDRLNDAIEGSTSLSNAGGGAVRVQDAESIAAMNENDFAAWLSKNPGKFKKLAGG